MLRLAFISVLTLLIVGCTTTSNLITKVWPAYDRITIEADNSVNPDIDQRPSPVKIKIYELSSRTTIDNLDFFKAFRQGKAVLSDELLSEVSFVLQPNEVLKHEIKPNKDTQFIAILAGYRNIDVAKWKHVYGIEATGHYNHYFTLSAKGIIVGKVVEDKEAPEGSEAHTDNQGRDQFESTKGKVGETQNQVDDAKGKVDSVRDNVESAPGKVDGLMTPPDDIKEGVDLLDKGKLPTIKAPSF